MTLAVAEQLLMMVGLGVFLVSLILYVLRTSDFKSIIIFWQATISFTKREFLINRIGLSMMVLAVIVRFYNHFFA
ncbi:MULTISPECIES: hypothetical protein [Amphritea]|jgi:hypothetical protein|uniref:Uncharacterized protein n=2 Tax=Amphritea TaxID=515417 RepID=A0A1H9E5I3_9GAMM|nr:MULTISPECIES: hypothetical protein [Amphritea]MBN0985774.1 hypothetical protein [Amphritea pacifica]MBN1005855.1 hypothetical protein [Amphritea pacifica]SEQ20503.1 hypothetical protein SAMN03080615_00679 [Amphritea atlantica]